MASWRKGTKSCYSKYLKLWEKFCSTLKIDLYEPEISIALSFLQTLYEQGYNYGQINTACSALSAVIYVKSNISFGKLLVVKRFMKGVFQLKPRFPKYSKVWDVNNVFEFFRKLKPPEELPLKILTLKLCMLIMLISGGQRSQTIHLIKRKNINFINDNLVFIPIMNVVKQTKANNHIKPLKLKTYEDKKLCVVSHLKIYQNLVQALAPDEEQLFVSYIKPHKAVSKDTIARWCRETLKMSGIDTKKYSTHSSRSAATSKAKEKGVPLKTIIDSAGWKNERMFATTYERTIENDFNII